MIDIWALVNGRELAARMAALVSRIFSLHFCTVGKSGDGSSIFVYVSAKNYYKRIIEPNCCTGCSFITRNTHSMQYILTQSHMHSPAARNGSTSTKCWFNSQMNAVKIKLHWRSLLETSEFRADSPRQTEVRLYSDTESHIDVFSCFCGICSQ